MNKEEPYRDQAERLRRRIEKINEQTIDNDSLPPREQIHRQKKKKTKFKIKYPVIRLLVLFFILLPIIYFSVVSYLDGKKINRTEKTSGNSAGYEPINIKNQTEDNSSKTIEKKKESKQDHPGATISPEKTNNSEGSTDKIEQPIQTDAVNQKSSTSNNTDNQNLNSTSSGNTTPAPVTKTVANTTKVIYHTVNPQETIYRIARKYYPNSSNGVDIIKKANHLTSDHITVGQVLKILLKN